MRLVLHMKKTEAIWSFPMKLTALEVRSNLVLFRELRACLDAKSFWILTL